MNHESQLFFARVSKNYPFPPWPKLIGIHGSSFRYLIPPLRLCRCERVREVTKFRVAIRDNATVCSRHSHEFGPLSLSPLPKE